MLRSGERGYTYEIKLGLGGNAQSLFFSKENLIVICHWLRYVFLIDCTYKTINNVFPNTAYLLCIWHINTNIVAITSGDNWYSDKMLKVFMAD
jgi:hypothetical protein